MMRMLLAARTRPWITWKENNEFGLRYGHRGSFEYLSTPRKARNIALLAAIHWILSKLHPGQQLNIRTLATRPETAERPQVAH